MCGIAGIWNPNLSREKEIFERMLLTLSHRGPDEKGDYSDPRLIFGNTRLSILDLENGRQPIEGCDETVLVVLNGEIYNHATLREELESKGHRFKTKTDTEVLTHLYEEKGEAFVEKLRGMFAFALYDKKNEKLFLARDRVGKKPLFYARIGQKIFFASEIKALLTHPGIPKEPNFTALYHYLTLKHIPRPDTAFRGIDSLLPAEMLDIDRDGNIKKKRYWRISFEPQPVEEGEAIEILLQKLKESVKLRVYSSDVPVGAFLSGGLDSSLIVALMREYAGGELHTFSLAYEEGENPDIPFARDISKKFETTHHEYVLKTNEIPEMLPRIVRAFDEPFGGVISTFFLTRLIKEHVKVALSGDGADELYGSYANHRLAYPIFYYLRDDERFKSWNLETEKIKALADANPASWRTKLYDFPDELKRDLLTQRFLENCNGASTFLLVEKLFNESRSTDPLNRVLEVDFHDLLPEEVLTYVDRLSMAHGVEVRSPFLDQEVAAFSSSLPGECKITPAGTKIILRKLARRYLPDEILERPKKGFILPFHQWLLGSLREFTLQKFSSSNIRKSGFFKEERIQSLLEKQLKGEKNYTYGLFSTLMFLEWWERYFG